MHIINKEVTELKSLLYSRTESGRVTVVQALAYAVVVKTNMIEESVNVDMGIKNIVNEICELAIMDRVALERAIINMYMFTHIKESINNRKLHTAYPTDFETATFASELISKVTVDNVNGNMSMFNSIVRLATVVLPSLIDD